VEVTVGCCGTGFATVLCGGPIRCNFLGGSLALEPLLIPGSFTGIVRLRFAGIDRVAGDAFEEDATGGKVGGGVYMVSMGTRTVDIGGTLGS